MDEPITISSDSDTDDSDVEFIDCFSNVVKLDDPLTAARVDVDTVKVNIPTVS